MSIPTPQIAHLTEEDYRYIYEPAEDSFILLDALEIEADEIRASSPSLSIEIGLVKSFSVRILIMIDRAPA